MTDRDEVLAANLEFYRAFTMRDWEGMKALWASRLPVSCIHPGWSILRGRDAVIESWRNILANPDSPRIMCHDEEASLYGDVAIVTCEEALTANTLAATNVFAREDGGWRIVHHQAGPSFMQQRSPGHPPPGRLN